MQKEVNIVGAGVVGITAAYVLLGRGLRVRVKSSGLEPIAGRNGVGILERQGETITLARRGSESSFSSIDWEDQTFQVFERWLAAGMPWVRKMPVTYHRVSKTEEPFESPFPGMEAIELSPDELVAGFSVGVRFDGYIINTRQYYDFLREQVEQHPLFLGFELVDIQSPDEIDDPLVLIACGLGQRRWDPAVFPGLGETLIVDSPEVPRDRVVGAILPDYSGNVVPIPGSANEVLVGASKRDGLDYQSPRDEWWDKILELGTRAVPELASGKILDRRLGCRPKRKGGVRLELIETPISRKLISGGFGGAGWTLSYGHASAAYSLLTA